MNNNNLFTDISKLTASECVILNKSRFANEELSEFIRESDEIDDHKKYKLSTAMPRASGKKFIAFVLQMIVKKQIFTPPPCENS